MLKREATGARASLAPRCHPTGGEPGKKGASPPRDGHLRTTFDPPATHPRGSLTIDFSCPRLGGTKPARSRERRQDARKSRAMVGGGRVSDSPETLSDPGPQSV